MARRARLPGTDGGRTPLHWAAHRDELAKVKERAVLPEVRQNRTATRAAQLANYLADIANVADHYGLKPLWRGEDADAPGQRLPAIRHVAATRQISPTTVASRPSGSVVSGSMKRSMRRPLSRWPCGQAQGSSEISC